MRSLPWLIIVTLLMTGGCASSAHMLKAGAVAPDLTGEAADGSVVSLSSRRGHPAVIYFYPKDDTPGCTREACAFRDSYARYAELEIAIFGVSRDDAESHRAFRAEYQLPFIMVADTDARAQHAYGVGGILGMASRVTFLVGPDGRIAHVWHDVDPGVHAKQVLQMAEPLVIRPASR